MQKLKSILISLPAAALLLLGGLTAVAYAHDGGFEPSDSQNTEQNKPDGSSDSTDSTSASSESDQTQTTETEDQNQNEAKDLLHNLRMGHHEHSAMERVRFCQAAQNGLEHKLTNLGKNADKFLARIDKVFTLVQNYQKDNNITVTNWDQLVAAAQAAQTKAASSVTALDGLSVNLDCTSSTVAENVATFKTAAQQAREDLHSYKMAVKDIIKALEAAKDSTDQGGTNDTSN